MCMYKHGWVATLCFARFHTSSAWLHACTVTEEPSMFHVSLPSPSCCMVAATPATRVATTSPSRTRRRRGQAGRFSIRPRARGAPFVLASNRNAHLMRHTLRLPLYPTCSIKCRLRLWHWTGSEARMLKWFVKDSTNSNWLSPFPLLFMQLFCNSCIGD